MNEPNNHCPTDLLNHIQQLKNTFLLSVLSHKHIYMTACQKIITIEMILQKESMSAGLEPTTFGVFQQEPKTNALPLRQDTFQFTDDKGEF